MNAWLLEIRRRQVNGPRHFTQRQLVFLQYLLPLLGVPLERHAAQWKARFQQTVIDHFVVRIRRGRVGGNEFFDNAFQHLVDQGHRRLDLEHAHRIDNKIVKVRPPHVQRDEIVFALRATLQFPGQDDQPHKITRWRDA
ncbi:hypothetical protein D3C76_839560 [compost metagenome]